MRPSSMAWRGMLSWATFWSGDTERYCLRKALVLASVFLTGADRLTVGMGVGSQGQDRDRTGTWSWIDFPIGVQSDAYRLVPTK